MVSFEQFKQAIQIALNHLYDPGYCPDAIVLLVVDKESQNRPGALFETIKRGIALLRPETDIPLRALGRRTFDVLNYRYLENRTQEETADLMHISPRHLRREQKQAVEALATVLWRNRSGEHFAGEGDEVRMPDSSGEAQDDEQLVLRSQARRELISLLKPGAATADLPASIETVFGVVSPLFRQHDVGLLVATPAPGMLVDVHPTLLHELLIAVLSELLRHMSSGEVRVAVQRKGERISVLLNGSLADAVDLRENTVLQELLNTVDVCIVYTKSVDTFAIELSFADVRSVRVLVIDDNFDLVHYFRRYVERTRYTIFHESLGENALEAVLASRPHIIVLDVLLPDIDGWVLLMQLRQESMTRSTPIIVCSVIREEELALTLGATLYVPKPVRRKDFLQALDYALAQRSSEEPQGL